MAEPESSAVENATPLPSVESIEVDPPVKDEDHEMNEDLVEDGDPMDTGIDGPEVTPDQYKALRNVCEHLHSYKIKIKGDEYAGCLSVWIAVDADASKGTIILPTFSAAFLTSVIFPTTMRLSRNLPRSAP